jgi:TfoX/Sxy family transcriptional regulator of competence genes
MSEQRDGTLILRATSKSLPRLEADGIAKAARNLSGLMFKLNLLNLSTLN